MAYRFESLEIWQGAIKFADLVYKITKRFPREEIFSLTSQLRRAAVSISANIAEGSSSATNKEFKMFLSFAIRSNAEVTSELVIARNMGYINDNEFSELYSIGEVLIKRITNFKNKLP